MALVQDASLLTRLVFRDARIGASRSEVSLLGALRSGPQQITTLAESEGLAQPTVSALVGQLEDRGLVVRDRSPDDGRVVLVSITAAGREALADLRERYLPLLRDYFDDLGPARLARLAELRAELDDLVRALQEESAR